MAGALSVVGSSVLDSHTGPCLCVDARMNLNSTRKNGTRPGSVELGSPFLDSWVDWRDSSKSITNIANRRSWKTQHRKDKRFLVVDELGGQYEESFGDVEVQIANYFTYKAVRTVLNQLYEMNPPQYTWFYNYVAVNRPTDGKRFLRSLAKERHELAERVMITRLHLYGKWIKKCDHGKIYEGISKENLELMRERLMETVIWPSDDTNTEKIA